MAVAGGLLALLLIILRRMNISKRPWAKRLLSPSEGAPYAVAIAIGALLAAPSSPLLVTGLSAFGV
jgi:Flp pilus assembly protein protease CpaA